MIYFDNASTSRPFAEVLDIYQKLSVRLFGNPSSVNGAGLLADNYLERARKQILSLLGLDDGYEIIFASGATEANNMAILGYARRHAKQGRHLITSLGEHASVLNVFRELEKEGFEVTYLGLDGEGRISPESLEKAMRPDTLLVSLMSTNNEAGTVYPLSAYSRIVRSSPQAVFMSDVTQGIFKNDIPFRDLDMFTMSGHKIGGLKSSGILAKRKKLLLDPIVYGGGQESGLRSGTLNAPLDCALAAAFRLAKESYEMRRANAGKLRSYLYESLSGLKDEILIISPESQASPFILSFCPLHYKASVLVEALSAEEIYVSTRSACSARAKGVSGVLHAMGYDDFIASNSIRLSFEGDETLADGETFMKVLKRLFSTLKRI